LYLHICGIRLKGGKKVLRGLKGGNKNLQSGQDDILKGRCKEKRKHSGKFGRNMVNCNIIALVGRGDRKDGGGGGGARLKHL
jgi:hypothetical protein